MAIEGDSLYEVVESALLKEGENLKIIVENWFETGFKTKVKNYIDEIIASN